MADPLAVVRVDGQSGADVLADLADIGRHVGAFHARAVRGQSALGPVAADAACGVGAWQADIVDAEVAIRTLPGAVVLIRPPRRRVHRRGLCAVQALAAGGLVLVGAASARALCRAGAFHPVGSHRAREAALAREPVRAVARVLARRALDLALLDPSHDARRARRRARDDGVGAVATRAAGRGALPRREEA